METPPYPIKLTYSLFIKPPRPLQGGFKHCFYVSVTWQPFISHLQKWARDHMRLLTWYRARNAVGP